MTLKNYEVKHLSAFDIFQLFYKGKLLIVFHYSKGEVLPSIQNEQLFHKLYSQEDAGKYLDSLTAKIREYYAKRAELDVLGAVIEDLFYRGPDGSQKA